MKYNGENTMKRSKYTIADARKDGYEIERGAYYGTSDDRADRWYIVPTTGLAEKSGSGFRTRSEALDYLFLSK